MLMDLLKQTLRTDRTVDERRALEGDFFEISRGDASRADESAYYDDYDGASLKKAVGTHAREREAATRREGATAGRSGDVDAATRPISSLGSILRESARDNVRERTVARAD